MKQVSFACMEIVTSAAGELYLELLINCLCGWIYPESGWRLHREFKLGEQKVELPPEMALAQLTPFDPALRHEGRDWPTLGYTMIGRMRLGNVRHCVEEVLRNDVPGDLIETGVWRGGSAMLMRAILKLYQISDRSVWLADSFEGMPKPGAIENQVMPGQPDLSTVDYLKASLEEVSANFERFGLLDHQVKFVKGWFNETLKTIPITRIAVLRVDCDLYESTMEALVGLYDRLSPGGFVIIDDYNDWPSCRRAVDDFRLQRKITFEIQRIDRNAVFWQTQ